MGYAPFTEKKMNTAEELWEALSPTREIIASPYNLIYRGQASANWGLIPSVLRSGSTNPASRVCGAGVKAEEQIFTEVRLLEEFSEFCDQIGIRIPND